MGHLSKQIVHALELKRRDYLAKSRGPWFEGRDRLFLVMG
jgi:hypothetical protein